MKQKVAYERRMKVLERLWLSLDHLPHMIASSVTLWNKESYTIKRSVYVFVRSLHRGDNTRTA